MSLSAGNAVMPAVAIAGNHDRRLMDMAEGRSK